MKFKNNFEKKVDIIIKEIDLDTLNDKIITSIIEKEANDENTHRYKVESRTNLYKVDIEYELKQQTLHEDENPSKNLENEENNINKNAKEIVETEQNTTKENQQFKPMEKERCVLKQGKEQINSSLEYVKDFSENDDLEKMKHINKSSDKSNSPVKKIKSNMKKISIMRKEAKNVDLNKSIDNIRLLLNKDKTNFEAKEKTGILKRTTSLILSSASAAYSFGMRGFSGITNFFKKPEAEVAPKVQEVQEVQEPQPKITWSDIPKKNNPDVLSPVINEYRFDNEDECNENESIKIINVSFENEIEAFDLIPNSQPMTTSKIEANKEDIQENQLNNKVETIIKIDNEIANNFTVEKNFAEDHQIGFSKRPIEMFCSPVRSYKQRKKRHVKNELQSKSIDNINFLLNQNYKL